MTIYVYAISSQQEVFFNSKVVRDIHLNCRWNIGHIPLFKIIWGRDGVFEPIYLNVNKFFWFHKTLVRWTWFLWEKIGTKMHIIPWIIWCCHRIHNFHIIVEDYNVRPHMSTWCRQWMFIQLIFMQDMVHMHNV